jgi:exosortase
MAKEQKRMDHPFASRLRLPMTSATRLFAVGRPSRHDWLYGMFVAMLVVMSSPAFAALIRLSDRDASASHLPLIPLVSMGLLWLDRADIFRESRLALVPGSVLILIGVAIMALAEVTIASDNPNRLTVQMAAIVVAAVGGFIACYGPVAARAALFPLAFLLFMVPFPPRLLEGAIEILKVGSTEVVDGLFALTRTTYHRDGFVFSLPTLTIEVADECSGIRSSIALLLTSVLAGHMFLRTGWKRATLVAVVLPITIVKNGIRIVALSLLSIYVDPGFIEGRLHHEGGLVFFLLALALFAPVLGLLCRSERSVAAN